MLLSLLASAAIGYAAGYGGAALLGAVVEWFIDADSLTSGIAENYEDAFKLLIKEKKKTAVKVGVFDEEDVLLDDVQIESEQGVSNDLYEGQVIYV